MRTRIAHAAAITVALSIFVLSALVVMGSAIITHSPTQYAAQYASTPVSAGSITFDNGDVDVTGVEVRTLVNAHTLTGAHAVRPVRAHGESYRHYWLRLAKYIRAHGPACEYEDASGPRDLRPGCVWNAGTAGNGIGQSFVALNHGVTADGTQRVTYVYDSGQIEFGGWGV